MPKSPVAILEDAERGRLPPTPPSEEELSPRSRSTYIPPGLTDHSYATHRHVPPDSMDVKETHVVTPPHSLRGSSSTFDRHHYTLSSLTPSSTILSFFDRARTLVASEPSSPNLSGYSLSARQRVTVPQTPAFAFPSLSSLRFAALCALWYSSSALSSNTGKAILAHFRYPVTLTWIQFGFVASWCATFCAFKAKASGQPPLSGIKRANASALRGTFVMSLFQIAGHVFSSMAIANIPVSTVHTIKALSPLFTVMSYAILFGVRYSSATYASLLPLTLGVMMACSFDLRANALGLICALCSTIVFVSQNIFSKKLLPSDISSSPLLNSGSHRLDKLNLLLYSSFLAWLLMIPIWFYSDGPSLFFASQPIGRPSSGGPGRLQLLGLFALNGTVHFGQCLLAFTILSRCSPITYSIASLFKRLAVIVIAIIWFRQPVYLLQAIGMTMTFVGLWMYNRAKADVAKGERKRSVVEKRQSMSLPTTNSDIYLEPAASTSTPQQWSHPHLGNHHHGGGPEKRHSPRDSKANIGKGYNDPPWVVSRT